MSQGKWFEKKSIEFLSRFYQNTQTSQYSHKTLKPFVQFKSYNS